MDMDKRCSSRSIVFLYFHFCIVSSLLGVMNAPENVVFPGHSTGLWSLVSTTDMIGRPLGSFMRRSPTVFGNNRLLQPLPSEDRLAP